ncbi:hypothetical protein [[Clostridium] aminophilum]|uniref:Translation initiation factor 2 n=1 Tax=[Clostridium] aminophilum TaxID=1526 RepID=A0A1I6J642_9FIRM|nr:hypothetical protein [[Clostridium] aminophilum]SFR74412.1 hypothetical protein SAMN02910262_01242 [[Clostridium] aminophilum]
MHGEYKIRVKNSRNSYSFTLRRNLTILRGESGRGKTTLFDMIREYNRYGKESGVSISCDRELIAIEGDQWEDEILRNPGKIVIIDEDSHFIRSKDFAETVKGSDNYYLLITRDYLEQLPVSVDEIYRLSGTKNKRFVKIYTEIERMYDAPVRRYLPFRPQVIITEDKRSGFQFFESVAKKMGISCVSAEGKSQVLSTLNRYSEMAVVVVADGAAFGAEMEDVVRQQALRPRKIALFLPESFEWIVLKSGVVELENNEQLDSPELFANSEAFMSWEQYFTKLLMDATQNSEFKKYRKDKLANYYLQDRVVREIEKEIPGVDLKESEDK